MGQFSYTLCWDCANATGFCSWSQEGIPVEGWDAAATKIKSSSHNVKPIDSFIVHRCPRFIQDAESHGLRKVGEKRVRKRV